MVATSEIAVLKPAGFSGKSLEYKKVGQLSKPSGSFSKVLLYAKQIKLVKLEFDKRNLLIDQPRSLLHH